MNKRKVPDPEDDSSSSSDDEPISKRYKVLAAQVKAGVTATKSPSKTTTERKASPKKRSPKKRSPMKRSPKKPSPKKGPMPAITKPGVYKEDEGLCWAVLSEGVKPCDKVASFDIDGTIVSPKSLKKNGKPNKFPQTRDDWRFWHPVNHLHGKHNQKASIVQKLKALHESGTRIVFFTNQAGISKGKQKLGDITGKIQDLAKASGVPITGFISGQKDKWRKPNTDMWDMFVRKYNNGSVDLKQSCYVGDAAGREKRKIKFDRPRDFSCSDRKYAANIGVKFHTPDAFFYGEKEYPFVWRGLNPKDWIVGASKQPLFVGTPPTIPANSQEVVIMVGFPASGKTTFCKKHLVKNGYEWINRDTLKTDAKCKKALGEALKKGKSAVVDNTNPKANKRADYMKVCQKHGVPVRCFVMSSNKEQVQHFNNYRQKMGGPRVPEIAINVFNKHYQKPSKSEGFKSLHFVNFVPEFDSQKEREKFLEFN